MQFNPFPSYKFCILDLQNDWFSLPIFVPNKSLEIYKESEM